MINLLKALYCCGAMSTDTIKSMGISESLIDELIRKEQVITKIVGTTALYKLNDFGEKIYRMETGKKQFYRCENWEKMMRLSEFYASLSPEERDTWKSKDEWYYEGYVGSIPDATYLKDGEMYGVFVQTEYTTKRTISQVEGFVKERRISKMSYIK